MCVSCVNINCNSAISGVTLRYFEGFPLLLFPLPVFLNPLYVSIFCMDSLVFNNCWNILSKHNKYLQKIKICVFYY